MARYVLFFTLLGCATAAAGDFNWPANGKKSARKCAIVLTYDDALRSQLDIAIPQLDAAQLRQAGLYPAE